MKAFKLIFLLFICISILLVKRDKINNVNVLYVSKGVSLKGNATIDIYSTDKDTSIEILNKEKYIFQNMGDTVMFFEKNRESFISSFFNLNVPPRIILHLKNITEDTSSFTLQGNGTIEFKTDYHADNLHLTVLNNGLIFSNNSKISSQIMNLTVYNNGVIQLKRLDTDSLICDNKSNGGVFLPEKFRYYKTDIPKGA